MRVRQRILRAILKKTYIPEKVKALGGLFTGELPEHASSASLPIAAGFFTEPSGKFFMNGLAVLAVIMLVRELRHQNKPVRVAGVTKTSDGRLRVDLENRGSKPLMVKPSVRKVHIPTKEERESLNGIPMLAASSATQRVAYDLLGESASAVSIGPGESRQIFIDCAQAADASVPVSVSVAYGKAEGELTGHMSVDVRVREPNEHPYLRNVGTSRAFILKKDHGEIVGEAFMLEGLLKAVESAPEESISFHLREGNDFALWVRDVVGDGKLALVLAEVKADDPESARTRIAEAIRGRMMDVEGEDFSGKHPNLNPVGEAYTFKLKADHDEVVGEAAFLEELRDGILASPTDVVIYHMREGNDFADWARDVLGDQTLSDALRSVELISPKKTQELLAKIIDMRIKELGG